MVQICKFVLNFEGSNKESIDYEKHWLLKSIKPL